MIVDCLMFKLKSPVVSVTTGLLYLIFYFFTFSISAWRVATHNYLILSFATTNSCSYYDTLRIVLFVFWEQNYIFSFILQIFSRFFYQTLHNLLHFAYKLQKWQGYHMDIIWYHIDLAQISHGHARSFAYHIK